jgi:5-methylcytosine-specific restriction endonuclease McrA
LSASLFSAVHGSGEAVAADKRVAVAPMLGVNSKARENSAGQIASSEECLPRMQKTVRMAVTLNEQQWEKYRRACNLSNHSSTGGDVAEVMEMLLDLYLKRHEGKPAKSQKEAESCDETNACRDKKSVEESRLETSASLTSLKQEAPETRRGRYIPQKIRREVLERDGNRCTFVSAVTGQRCECERGLQFDHIKPFALGGDSNTSQNLRLLCAAHNRLAAENVFGTEFMSRKVKAAGANSAV